MGKAGDFSWSERIGESPSFREEYFPGRMPKASFDEIRDDFFAEVVALSALGGN